MFYKPLTSEESLLDLEFNTKDDDLTFLMVHYDLRLHHVYVLMQLTCHYITIARDVLPGFNWRLVPARERGYPMVAIRNMSTGCIEGEKYVVVYGKYQTHYINRAVGIDIPRPTAPACLDPPKVLRRHSKRLTLMYGPQGTTHWG